MCLAALNAIALLIASSVLAKTETITCEYKYVLGDNDTKHDARKIAFVEAKRRCAEQIGTLLTSETVVSSSDLTKDEIRAYSLSVMKTDVVAESFLPSGDGLAILIKLTAHYDSDLMSSRLKELLSDRGRSSEFKQAQEQIVALEKQVMSLQRQLSVASPDEDIVRLREERNIVLSQYDRIIRSLETLNTRTSQYVRCGMREEEVRSVLGSPRTIRPIYPGKVSWNYGDRWLSIMHGVVIAIGINDSSPLEGKGCTSR